MWRGHDVHVDDGPLARTPLHVVDERHLIDDGLGVGHAHDGRDAAGGRRKTRGLERLAVLLTRIAREDLAIDKPWRQHMALAVDDLSALRRIAPQMPPRSAMSPSRTSNPPGSSRPDAGSISRALMNGRRHLVGGRTRLAPAGLIPAQWFGRCRASASSTAMRTATPISTWSRMTLREWSAIGEAISTPRFMGPGCMISASGLARDELVVIESEEMVVLACRGHIGALHALALQPQHHDDVAAL